MMIRLIDRYLTADHAFQKAVQQIEAVRVKRRRALEYGTLCVFLSVGLALHGEVPIATPICAALFGVEAIVHTRKLRRLNAEVADLGDRAVEAFGTITRPLLAIDLQARRVAEARKYTGALS